MKFLKKLRFDNKLDKGSVMSYICLPKIIGFSDINF